jgi:thymidylate synthase (FAD)
MQVVKAGFEIFPIISSHEMIKKIEQVARVCYKSEDKICEGSAKKMVRALVNRKHYAMLEHGSVIVIADEAGYLHLVNTLEKIRDNEGEVPYIRYTPKKYSGRYMISGNFRAWLEFLELCNKYDFFVSNVLLSILKQDKYSPIFDTVEVKEVYKAGYAEIEPTQLTAKEKLIHLYLSVKFIVDRGVSHEIVRHRRSSFAQESTRYCNYGNIGGEITVIDPCFFATGSFLYESWKRSCEVAEKAYLKLLQYGATPQEARDALPTSVKTEVVMTATIKVWRHFFNLRAVGATGKPHPQMEEVAVPLLGAVKEIIPVVFDDMEA